MKEMICICCPIGCRLQVDESGTEIKVSGNQCKRGEKYALEEIIAPKRLVTSIVRVRNGHEKMLSVKTSDRLPKGLIFQALETLKDLEVDAPVQIGDVIVRNILNTGIDFIATKNITKE
jgi:CxxC motif-containing protein